MTNSFIYKLGTVAASTVPNILVSKPRLPKITVPTESPAVLPKPAPKIEVPDEFPEVIQRTHPITDYTNRANAYLARYPKTPIKGEMLANAWNTAGRPKVDPAHAVAQSVLESSAGTKGRNPVTNPYNVGEFDVGTTQRFPNIEAGINAYYKLMADRYLAGGKSTADLQHKFVDVNGRRYASDPRYESKLRNIITALTGK